MAWSSAMRRSPPQRCCGPQAFAQRILAEHLSVPTDQAGRVVTAPDLTIEGHPEVFVLGDMSSRTGANGHPLPGVALVAMQEGIYAANVIRKEVAGRAPSPREPFKYVDLGPDGDHRPQSRHQ